MTILGRGRPNRKYPLLTTVLRGSTLVTLAESATGTDVLGDWYPTVPWIAPAPWGPDLSSVITLADSGAFADALTVSTPITLAESGTGTDALTVTLRQANLAETGTATDALTVAAVAPLAETGTGTTLLGVDGVPVSLTGQTGTFTDAFTVTLRLITLTETGALTDSMFALGPAVIAPGVVVLASANDGEVVLASANTGSVTLATAVNGQVLLATSGAGVATVTSSADAEVVLASAGAGLVTVQT